MNNRLYSHFIFTFKKYINAFANLLMEEPVK